MFLKKNDTEGAPIPFRSTHRGDGFVKEDVLAFIDQLNLKIYDLQVERDRLQKKLEAAEKRLHDLEG